MNKILHYILLPLRLIISLFYFSGLHVSILFQKKRAIPENINFSGRAKIFQKMLLHLPVFKTLSLELHLNGLVFGTSPNGSNHNTENQLMLHGTYSYVMKLLDKHSDAISNATAHHIQPHEGNVILAKGYRGSDGTTIQFDTKDTTSDQLLGLTLAVMTDDNEWLREKFELLVLSIIKNNYCLVNLDGSKHKIEPIILYATLKVAANMGIREAKSHYDKAVVLDFPILKNNKKRTEYVTATYILSKLSKTSVAKRYWSIQALYAWSMTYNQYNGYTSGYIGQLWPDLLKASYYKTCENYLFEEEPNFFSKKISESLTPDQYPVKINNMNTGEFLGNQEQKISIGEKAYQSTLGWVAAVVNLSPEIARKYL